MFTINEVTNHYNSRGDLVKTESREIFASECPVAMLKRCYEIDPESGYLVTKPYIGMKKFVYLARMKDRFPISFGEIFRIVEGGEKYNEIMNDDNAYVFEEEWVLSK